MDERIKSLMVSAAILITLIAAVIWLVLNTDRALKPRELWEEEQIIASSFSEK